MAGGARAPSTEVSRNDAGPHRHDFAITVRQETDTAPDRASRREAVRDARLPIHGIRAPATADEHASRSVPAGTAIEPRASEMRAPIEAWTSEVRMSEMGMSEVRAASMKSAVVEPAVVESATVEMSPAVEAMASSVTSAMTSSMASSMASPMSCERRDGRERRCESERSRECDAELVHRATPSIRPNGSAMRSTMRGRD